MVLMVSGRTDIVAFYSKWFINRYQSGFVDVRNPFHPKMISRIDFKNVDLILFCTKNPIPILDVLKKITHPILFHVTLTPYKRDIEPDVPSKKMLIESIKKLSTIVGIDHLYIRYDPIFLNEQYTLEYHVKAFQRLCKLLRGSVKHIIISFIDDYKNVRKNFDVLQYRSFTEEDYRIIGTSFSKIAKENDMTIQTCFEDENLVKYGFQKGDCLSHELVFKLTGKTGFKNWRARKEKKCSCVEMVDIGVYNTCRHFCKYCYANFDEKQVKCNSKLHDPNSSILIGTVAKDDMIKERIK